MDIGDRIKNLLRMKGLSQTKLSAMLGISPARLNNYLNSRSEPSINLLCKIADSLETSADFLLSRTDEAIGSGKGQANNQAYKVLPFLDKQSNTKMLINYVPVYLTANFEDASQNNETPYRWVYINSQEADIHDDESVYGLIVQDNSLYPQILKNDLAIIKKCEIIPEVIRNNQAYVFKRDKNDTIGVTVKMANYSNGILIAHSGNYDYAPTVFNLKQLKFNPISGRVFAIMRTL